MSFFAWLPSYQAKLRGFLFEHGRGGGAREGGGQRGQCPSLLGDDRPQECCRRIVGKPFLKIRVTLGSNLIIPFR